MICCICQCWFHRFSKHLSGSTSVLWSLTSTELPYNARIFAKNALVPRLYFLLVWEIRHTALGALHYYSRQQGFEQRWGEKASKGPEWRYPGSAKQDFKNIPHPLNFCYKFWVPSPSRITALKIPELLCNPMQWQTFCSHVETGPPFVPQSGQTWQRRPLTFILLLRLVIPAHLLIDLFSPRMGWLELTLGCSCPNLDNLQTLSRLCPTPLTQFRYQSKGIELS